MKLRNKKTGEMKKIWKENICLSFGDCNKVYYSLKELNEEWEDYEPAEPLTRVGSPYDNNTYFATKEQEEKIRQFWYEEDKRPENQPIKVDLYGDDARFGGVFSCSDRPRNQAEFDAFKKGENYHELREKLNIEAKIRWDDLVKDLGLKNTSKAEPLIKDEKVRKAVRAWAEANEETEVKVKGACLVTIFKGLHKQLELELNCSWTRDGVYTIAELCGEEEKCTSTPTN